MIEVIDEDQTKEFVRSLAKEILPTETLFNSLPNSAWQTFITAPNYSVIGDYTQVCAYVRKYFLKEMKEIAEILFTVGKETLSGSATPVKDFMNREDVKSSSLSTQEFLKVAVNRIKDEQTNNTRFTTEDDFFASVILTLDVMHNPFFSFPYVRVIAEQLIAKANSTTQIADVLYQVYVHAFQRYKLAIPHPAIRLIDLFYNPGKIDDKEYERISLLVDICKQTNSKVLSYTRKMSDKDKASDIRAFSNELFKVYESPCYLFRSLWDAGYEDQIITHLKVKLTTSYLFSRFHDFYNCDALFKDSKFKEFLVSRIAEYYKYPNHPETLYLTYLFASMDVKTLKSNFEVLKEPIKSLLQNGNGTLRRKLIGRQSVWDFLIEKGLIQC